MNEKEIRQLMLNLARNGLEAMQDKDRGALSVRTSRDNGAVDDTSGRAFNHSDF